MKNNERKLFDFSFFKKMKVEISAEKKSEIIKTSVFFAIALFACTLILACLSNLLAPVATMREEAEVLGAMEKVLPAEKYEDVEITFDKALGIYSAKKAFRGEEVLGYCIEASAKGYANEIRMVVGIDAAGAVLGVEILSIKETPGYGDRIQDEDFLSAFKGKKTELSVVRKKTDKENEISAVSGATVSSAAVKDGVNHSIAAVSQIRAEEKKKAEEEAAAIKAQQEALKKQEEELRAQEAGRTEDTALVPPVEEGVQ